MSQDINIKNKKASYEYHFIETYSAGMVLAGTEIKSIRLSKASIVEAYCYFVGNELFVKNMHIADYDKASFFKHEPKQDRKLLLNKQELKKLKKATQIKGQTIIPTRIFINESGYAKLDIALAKGKKIYDKREDLKTKDAKRDLDRAIAD